MPVDGVLLMLHGAMVAEGYDDCEGDLLRRVRALVGPVVPVGAELDLHCHLTDEMLEQATVLVGYKEYPHIDMMKRMLELFNILADTAEGVVKSTQHFHAGFAPISKQVLYAGDLGALPGDMLKIPLERADTSRLWPFVGQPLED